MVRPTSCHAAKWSQLKNAVRRIHVAAPRAVRPGVLAEPDPGAAHLVRPQWPRDSTVRVAI